jgi:hypothetical protein
MDSTYARAVSYREDRDADQARIVALEAELTAAKRRIDELEGTRSQALVLASGGALTPAGKPTTRAARWLGGPTRLALTRTFAAAYPADKFEELVDVIREVAGDRGRTELMRTSMTWWASSAERGAGPFTAITIAIKDGATTLTATDRLGQLAGAYYGGIGGGIGGGALAVPIGATIAMPVLAPVFFVAWLGGAYALCRTLFKRSAKKRAERLQIVFDRVAAEIERELRG